MLLFHADRKFASIQVNITTDYLLAKEKIGGSKKINELFQITDNCYGRNFVGHH